MVDVAHDHDVHAARPDPTVLPPPVELPLAVLQDLSLDLVGVEAGGLLHGMVRKPVVLHQMSLEFRISFGSVDIACSVRRSHWLPSMEKTR